MILPSEILSKYWGYSTFRPLQQEIIESVLQGKDVIALLPTGGGKSLCFQVPAMMTEGVCLVISPLIALMKDQVENLEKKGIAAAAIHSGLTQYETEEIFKQASEGTFKFLYLSPERIETNLFKDYITSINVNLVAIDEAHCISQWGYDFRPPYLRIVQLREYLPGVGFIALTASATPIVQDDIADKLRLKNSFVFRQSFEKPNVSFSVFNEEGKINKVVEILQKINGCAIVYCGSRRKTKEVAVMLQQQNIVADYYHAGLTQEERSNKQSSWINDTTRVMVCTNAFGMGIDKPNVRVVIHYDTPDCLENYYQEAGRAGRDGKTAYAVLLFTQNDITNLHASPDIKYPPFDEIKKVYQAIADYLHIAVGLGAGNYYDFDLNEFVKNFKLNARLVVNAIKVLEQEGHLSFNESIFLPSQVMFTASREAVRSLENAHPELDIIAKCLLRIYGGIFDNRISVYEKQIGRICRITVEEVQKRLLRLQAFGIIQYLPQKETPQLYYELNRASAAHLNIDHKRYLQRKKYYAERVQSMISYITLLSDCRSKYTASYFGDNTVKPCGICDNCLHKKAKPLSTADFEKALQQVFTIVSKEAVSLKTLHFQIKTLRKEHLQQVVTFLLNERKLEMNEFGELILN